MKLSFLLILLCFLNTGPVLSQNRVTIPNGKPIMVDGKFSDKEWSDSKNIITQDSTKLFFKQSKDYVFIGVQPIQKIYRGSAIDLYITAGTDKVYNLHASRKLGERQLESGQWKEWDRWDKWWTNDGSWSANYGRPDDIKEDGKTKVILLEDEGWEYQIRRDKFRADQWKILFDLFLMQEKLNNIKYPASGVTTKADNWLILKL